MSVGPGETVDVGVGKKFLQTKKKPFSRPVRGCGVLGGGAKKNYDLFVGKKWKGDRSRKAKMGMGRREKGTGGAKKTATKGVKRGGQKKGGGMGRTGGDVGEKSFSPKEASERGRKMAQNVGGGERRC